MPMSIAEHSAIIKAKLDTAHKAQHRAKVALDDLHEALAALVNDHGASAGVGEELATLAAVPKTPPSNE